jgi:hypothetical protein
MWKKGKKRREKKADKMRGKQNVGNNEWFTFIPFKELREEEGILEVEKRKTKYREEGRRRIMETLTQANRKWQNRELTPLRSGGNIRFSQGIMGPT